MQLGSTSKKRPALGISSSRADARRGAAQISSTRADSPTGAEYKRNATYLNQWNKYNEPQEIYD